MAAIDNSDDLTTALTAIGGEYDFEDHECQRMVLRFLRSGEIAYRLYYTDADDYDGGVYSPA